MDLIFRLLILATIMLPYTLTLASESDEMIMEKIKSAEQQTVSVMNEILKEWDVANYPNFLKSVAMTRTSWEVMKLKFKHKILSNVLGKGNDDTLSFVLAFMGSSVTAGHDTPFNESFPVRTGQLMAPPLEAVGIKLESRNAAMGNNPCVPYDLCPKTFAGADADLVHWEQSYNCFAHDVGKTGPVFEQFIRQSVHMRKHPVVVFSDSATPNWNEKECDKAENKGPVTIPSDEKRLYELATKGDTLKIVSELNIDMINKGEWGPQSKMIHSYQTMAGIQVWSHNHYEKYKCRGPYTRDWQCCSASWHPSKKGHMLRAAHHSFFWLAIFRDALQEIQNDKDALMQQLSLIDHHISKEGKHTPESPMYQSLYSDDMQCLNTFMPKHDWEADLRKWILPFFPAFKEGETTAPTGEGEKGEALTSAEPISGKIGGGWEMNIFEELTDKGIIVKAHSRGYLDYKYMLHGNRDSMPLNVRVNIQKGQGTFFLCEPPGNWGKLPPGFKTLWEAGTKVYFTKDVDTDAAAAGTKPFLFDASKAQELTFVNRKPTDSQVVCVDFDQFKPPVGKHVITVVPTHEYRVMISTLLLPA
jgi:hypothetical protein